MCWSKAENQAVFNKQNCACFIYLDSFSELTDHICMSAPHLD